YTEGFVPQKWMSAYVNYNEGSYELVHKDIVFTGIQDFSRGMKAVRHANGRDWWLVNFDWNVTRAFVYLLSPSGITLHHEQAFEDSYYYGWDQTIFSPSGNYFGRKT